MSDEGISDKCWVQALTALRSTAPRWMPAFLSWGKRVESGSALPSRVDESSSRARRVDSISRVICGHPKSVVELDLSNSPLEDSDVPRVRCSRSERERARPWVGYDYVDAAIDDHSRPTYAETRGNERPPASVSCL